MSADLVWRSPLPDVDPTPALFHEEVLAGAARWPERVAVVDAAGGRSLTYGQLVDGARRLAGGLRAHGTRPGEVLALVAANGPDYPIVLLGALAAGLVVAPATRCSPPAS
jgi:long-chain acyl-CoA synthetase